MLCFNLMDFGCNWMVEMNGLCWFCVMIEIIFDLLVEGNQKFLVDSEVVKCWVLVNLVCWGWFINVDSGLCLIFKMLFEYVVQDEVYVIMGYVDGVIIINVVEVDDVICVMCKEQLGELYCLMVGYMWYEILYFLFEWLLFLLGFLLQFCELFGDECVDYGEVLKQYYVYFKDLGQDYIIEYVIMYLYEDWVEILVYVLYLIDMIDSLMVIGLMGLDILVFGYDVYVDQDGEYFLIVVIVVVLVVNEINWVLDNFDVYFFVLIDMMWCKLCFVYEWLLCGGLMVFEQ